MVLDDCISEISQILEKDFLNLKADKGLLRFTYISKGIE